jgi:hypothetical protein
MKLWKCILLAFLLGPVTDGVIFAANIFHDEPWDATPKWPMIAGICVYYTAGIMNEVLAEWIINPLMSIHGPIDGILSFPVDLTIQMILWTAIVYLGSSVYSILYRHARRSSGHQPDAEP